LIINYVDGGDQSYPLPERGRSFSFEWGTLHLNDMRTEDIECAIETKPIFILFLLWNLLDRGLCLLFDYCDYMFSELIDGCFVDRPHRTGTLLGLISAI
jgi:hypothetical protein